MKIWRCPSGTSLHSIVVEVYWIINCSWTSLPLIDLNVLVHWLSFFEPYCPQFIDSSFDCLYPPADLNTVCFPSRRSIVLPPRSVEENWCHFCQEFANLVDVFFLKIFLILESNLTFQRSCQFKSDCWNEIREMPIFESIFGNQALLVKDPTHAIQCSPLIVLYFERKKIDSL